MPFVYKIKKRNQYYYYLAHNKLVNGKTVRDWVIYLGSAKRLKEMSSGDLQKIKPDEHSSSNFGLPSAVLNIAEKINLKEIIDKHCGKRKEKISIGQYMLLNVINRICDPTSKQQLADWYKGTALKRIFNFKEKNISSQSFWNNFNFLDEDIIRKIEIDLTKRVLELYHLDLNVLFYDPTNFSTYIDPCTESELPMFGHPKGGRSDLLQVNLALVVTREFGIPLMHSTYAGNIHDATKFKSITEELLERYKIFSKNCENITLVFDKGNNSEENFEPYGINSPYRIIGALKPSEYGYLIDRTSKDEYGFIDAGCLARRMEEKIYGYTKTVVITHSKKLYRKQSYTIKNKIRNFIKNTDELNENIKKKVPKYSGKKKEDNISSRVHSLLNVELKSGKKLFDIISYDIDKKDFTVTLNYRKDTLRWIRKRLGKNIIFTNNSRWKTEEIINGYYSKNKIEEQFKLLKNPHSIAITPMHCWTDKMIKVHVFSCVLSMLIVNLMKKELALQKVDLSTKEMLKSLSDIKETILFFPHPFKTEITYTKKNNIQKKLEKIFNLKNHQA